MRVGFCTVACFIIFSASIIFAGQTAFAQVKKKPKFRRLVPGVETTIPMVQDKSEAFSTHDVVEILQRNPELQWTPKQASASQTLHSKSKKVVHYQTVWNLEFTFKPLRMMMIDIPQSDGNLKKKLIWYMVYRVKNKGGHFQPTKENGKYTINQVNDTKIMFIPQFLLEPKDTKKMELIMDQYIPSAIPAIQKREDPNRKLLSSIDISKQLIRLSSKENDKSYWGVVTWENIDPGLDYFSIYVSGLTNAYRWTDNPAEVKKDSPVGKGRTFTRRILKLNFWRPGDSVRQHEEEIRLGYKKIPAYQWIWLPNSFSKTKKK